MKTLFQSLALIGIFGVAGLSSMPLVAQERVTVSRRPWFAVCVGNCPNYDVTVSADGRVIAKTRFYKRRSHEERFRVSRAEAADFRRKLRPFRPVGRQSDPLVCSHNVSPDEAPLVMKVTEIEIRSSDTDHPVRLVACDNVSNAGLKEAIRQALWSVHLYLDGRRRD